jgi:hypothetical protein
MGLTKERLAEFVGGDMEIRLYRFNLLFRGLIETATIDDRGTLIVRFKWLAVNTGGPRQPEATWTTEKLMEYSRDLLTYTEERASDGQIRLNSPIHEEVAILFPPNGEHLDPARVAGLTAT